jgi:hypothetical protein
MSYAIAHGPDLKKHTDVSSLWHAMAPDEVTAGISLPKGDL